MTVPTLGTLLAAVENLIARWNTRDAQMTAWLSGVAGGGPNSDGRYPLTNATGTTYMVLCPAALEDAVASPAASSQESSEAAQSASSSSESSATAAASSASLAASRASTAASARDLALTYQAQAASERAAAQAYREQLGDISTTLSSILARLDALESN